MLSEFSPAKAWENVKVLARFSTREQFPNYNGNIAPDKCYIPWNATEHSSKFVLCCLDAHFYGQIKAAKEHKSYLEKRLAVMDKLNEEQKQKLAAQAEELQELKQAAKRQRLPSQEPAGLRGKGPKAPSNGGRSGPSQP